MAYINVDISVFGMGGGATGLTGEERNEEAGARIEPFSDPPTANATLRVQGTPPVQSVVFSAAKQVEGSGAGVDPLAVGSEEGPARRLDSPPCRSPHQAPGDSASMTTGSGISTVAVPCTAWSPGEPGARGWDRGGEVGPSSL